jgi:hypothetical protein
MCRSAIAATQRSLHGPRLVAYAPTEYADLDELMIKCRAEGAKSFFAEAVGCYRAGAYRAAIVATWTAVIFDYVAKLRELELVGNREATNVLESFERARQNHDVEQSLRLEREALETAVSRFDLLTPLEKLDLQRLSEDRNRCAHPSLQAIDEPYLPTAELVRCHLRNAVEHLLSRPPLQGRHAWTGIWAEISSEYFPEEAGLAEPRLRLRLSRSRPSLIRRLLIELTKALLDDSQRLGHSRLRAALLATVSMFHGEAETLFREKLPTLVSGVEDGALHLLVRYCRHNVLAWPTLGPAAQARLIDFVRKTDEIWALSDALRVQALSDVVFQRPLDDSILVATVQADPSERLLDELVRRFEEEQNFATFRDLRPAIRNSIVSSKLSDMQMKRLIGAITKNSELRGYGGFHGVLQEIFGATRERAAQLRSEWIEVYSSLHSPIDVRSIREVYPDFPERESPDVASSV